MWTSIAPSTTGSTAEDDVHVIQAVDRRAQVAWVFGIGISNFQAQLLQTVSSLSIKTCA